MNKLLFLLLLSGFVQADIQYSWDIPTQREDGSALNVSEIDAYIIKYSVDNGPSVNHVIAGGSTTTATIPGGAGVHTAQIATRDTDGLTGEYSDVLTVTVGAIIKAPAAKQVLSGTWVCNETPCILEIK